MPLSAWKLTAPALSTLPTSPLAEKLFDIPNVGGVMFGSDFISVTKTDGEWPQIKPAVLGAIMEHYMSGAPLVAADAQAPGGFHLADTAADRERHEADVGGAGHHVQDGSAVLVGGGDVEEHQFIGAGGVIGPGLFHRIAGIAQRNKLHALHHPAVLDVQTRNDADFKHG